MVRLLKKKKTSIITVEKNIKGNLLCTSSSACGPQGEIMGLIAIKAVLWDWTKKKEAPALLYIFKGTVCFVFVLQIYLRFLDYEMQNSNECKRNFVAVYDGSSSVEDLKAKFCSTVANDVMLRTGLGVIRMWADEGSRNSRFQMLFTSFQERKIPVLDCLSFRNVQGCKAPQLLMGFSPRSLRTAGHYLISSSHKWGSFPLILMQSQVRVMYYDLSTYL